MNGEKFMILSNYDIFATEIECNMYKVIYVNCSSKTYMVKEEKSIDKFIDMANVIPAELLEVFLSGLNISEYTEIES